MKKLQIFNCVTQKVKGHQDTNLSVSDLEAGLVSA